MKVTVQIRALKARKRNLREEAAEPCHDISSTYMRRSFCSMGTGGYLLTGPTGMVTPYRYGNSLRLPTGMEYNLYETTGIDIWTDRDSQQHSGGSRGAYQPQ